MFETSGSTKKFFENIPHFDTPVTSKVPTFDRTLDSYFDRNFETIIEEWGLVTESDLSEYARKLDYLSYEVGRLHTEKDLLKKRADSIEKAISNLEARK
ncbi:hypothetical protein KHC33_05270 [Methanospirillum sp. J.3.6.1-F.2.7.3]|uniref:Uncharacterized protein n=1 Tax=Methanospirillum purgamenti TaxID=2834276 RepID=A0A8E7EKN5_9EURY|nr:MULTISPECIES: hypothetical protein [Methanospirillum]MDX8551454.1 hypothetical protein [Methanospirillum hungatei]QVV89911.1 hypothetical protein KHC33_05270 [Methanospirillum sp. J.3.6.1-F.2.7.3]